MKTEMIVTSIKSDPGKLPKSLCGFMKITAGKHPNKLQGQGTSSGSKCLNFIWGYFVYDFMPGGKEKKLQNTDMVLFSLANCISSTNQTFVDFQPFTGFYIVWL